MPFTLSHPAAALLLRRSGLPVSAVVAGAMTPDVPMFLPGRIGYHFTHSILGVLTVDLAMGLAGLIIWFGGVRDALVDTAPGGVRERLPATVRYTAREWAWAPVAVVLGSLTHVVWDAFTHPARWGTRHVGWLHTMHAGHVGSQWAQATSTAVGLALVMAWATTSLARRPRRPRPARVGLLAGSATPAVISAAILVGGSAAVLKVPDGLHAVAFAGAVVGTITLTSGLLLWSVLWRVLAGGALRP